jgi:hypothetical protein
MLRTIQGFSNYELSANKEVYNKNTSKLIKTRINRFGMTMVLLTDDNGNRQWKEVHDLPHKTFDDVKIQAL